MGDVSLERESDVDVSEERGGVVSMDTPERKQINTPVAKFEDSPVFNYLNNLSPIHPVKSVHITQTFNSLSFASLPSVFTSPHVSTIKESRFLRRHQLSDPSKFELTSENANKVGKQEEVVGIDHDSNEHQNFGKGSAAVEPPYDSNPSNELSRTLNNKSVSPDSDPTACSVMETKCIPELIGSSSALVPSVHIDSESCQVGSEFNIGEVSHIDQNKEVSGCDWENLLSVEADLSIFESPADLKSLKDPSQKPLKTGASFCTSLSDGLQNSGATQAVGPSQQSETDNMSFQHKESGNMMEIAENHDLLVSLSNCEAGDTNDIVDDEFASNMHRGLRRRCLVFEMAGSRRQPLNDVSNIGLGPSTLSHSYDNISSNDECLVPIKPGHDIPRCIQHGIGLHLNALASTSVNHKIVKHRALNTDRQPISAFPLAVCLNSSNRQEITKNSVVASSSERDMLPVGDDMSLVEDAVHASEDVVDEVFDHSSPKKKRCKLESGGESETCKRCNCKKSKCLKLYCECFAAGVYCVEPCACQECFNKPIHEDTVLAARMQIESRNPLAFAPKVIRSSESVIETGEESRKTPASARHKRGCNCKKSGCTKKYCECYQGGVGCSINCRCEGCKNAFGRKDGSTSKGIEVELDEEKEADTCRSVIDKSLQITTVQNDAEQNTNFALPETPLQFGRQLIELPLSSRNKRPPRATFLAIGSSSQKFKKLNPPQAKFEKHITVREDEMPEILQSPISVVKSVSPNSKRVSPPHCNTGFTSGLRSSRKLILQSIPSFPSLTPKQ